MAALKATALAALVAGASAASNICGTNITIGMSVAASLNLTYPGLEKVAAAVKSGDFNGACEELATYYATSNTSWWLRVPPVTPGTGLAGGVVDEMVRAGAFNCYLHKSYLFNHPDVDESHIAATLITCRCSTIRSTLLAWTSLQRCRAMPTAASTGLTRALATMSSS